MADVEVEIEIRVRDPKRVIQPERNLDQAPAQRLEQVQALLELRAPRGVRIVTGRVRAPEDRQPRNMPELRRRLEVQKRRIESGQLLHAHLAWWARSVHRLCERADAGDVAAHD